MIIVRLDKVMADRKASLGAVADAIGLAVNNLSGLKTGRKVSIRFETLNALCECLDCEPDDILDYIPDK